MTEADFDRFDALIQGVAECYCQTMSAQGIALRFKLLERFAYAEVEAGKVLTAISQYGAYASVIFDHAVTQAVIVRAYGGWPKMCAECGVEESEYWFRKNFAKTWAAYARQGVNLSGHLPGLVEISNASNGYVDFIPQPELVGDPDKARAVLEAGQSRLMLPPGQAAAHGELCSVSRLLDATASTRKRK